MKTIQVIVRTPSPHDRAPRFIKKSVKKSEKHKYWNSAKPGTHIMCSHKVSLHIKFEGSSWKIDFRNAKNAKVTWPAIMRAHIWWGTPDARSYSIPSKISTQVMHISKNWNPMKRIQVIIRTPPADGRTDGQTVGRTDWHVESSIPPNFVARGIMS